jgi:hypothetical protein
VRTFHVKAAAPLALITLFLISYPTVSFAKGKKYTLEQAWAICKAEIDKTLSKDAHSARYSAGGACLLRHGYRI